MVINRIYRHIREFLRMCWMEGMDNDEYVKYLRKHGIRIGENVHFRHPSRNCIDFTRPSLIEFGNNLDINERFTVLTHDFTTYVFRNYYNDFVNSSGKVVIGNNIVFGQNVTILKGVTIGDNCIIGYGSLITKSIPPNSVVAGSPAKVICTLDDFYKKRKAKQIDEALEYGATIDNPKVEDFTEEWCLFLSEKEYGFNKEIAHEVDKRMGAYPKKMLTNRPFENYKEFLEAIKAYKCKTKG